MKFPAPLFGSSDATNTTTATAIPRPANALRRSVIDPNAKTAPSAQKKGKLRLLLPFGSIQTALAIAMSANVGAPIGKRRRRSNGNAQKGARDAAGSFST